MIAGQRKTFKIYLNDTHYHDAVSTNGTIPGWRAAINPAQAGVWGIKLEIHEAAWPYKYLGEGAARDLKPGSNRIEARAPDGTLVDYATISVQDVTTQVRQLQLMFY